MINASNNIAGGARVKRKLKGGEESWGATGMPAQFYGAKLPSKVSPKSTTVKPNDSAVVNLAPLKGGKKTVKKPVKKTTTKKTTTKKPIKKTTTKKTTTKKPVKKTTTKKTTTKKPTTKKPTTKKSKTLKNHFMGLFK